MARTSTGFTRLYEDLGVLRSLAFGLSVFVAASVQAGYILRGASSTLLSGAAVAAVLLAVGIYSLVLNRLHHSPARNGPEAGHVEPGS